jgi:hypothetical protein
LGAVAAKADPPARGRTKDAAMATVETPVISDFLKDMGVFSFKGSLRFFVRR